ncbi:hypothetical protein JB92DRAFT_2838139 [Gautieria morchelliformis]|nr:hypothetical protein JB92DRAFT_2838139 [Gautieria morchelliformis]
MASDIEGSNDGESESDGLEEDGDGTGDSVRSTTPKRGSGMGWAFGAAVNSALERRPANKELWGTRETSKDNRLGECTCVCLGEPAGLGGGKMWTMARSKIDDREHKFVQCQWRRGEEDVPPRQGHLERVIWSWILLKTQSKEFAQTLYTDGRKYDKWVTLDQMYTYVCYLSNKCHSCLQWRGDCARRPTRRSLARIEKTGNLAGVTEEG